MEYPRPVTSIHQIEVTTFCSLRCKYCPSPKLEKHRGQPKQHMPVDTFKRTLEWCRHFERLGSQGELSLTGIGETLLHPEWPELVRLAREALPTNYINFSTNGTHLTDDACAVLAEHQVSVWVSLHRPEVAAPAMNRARRHGILDGPNAGASVSAFDWAGQVNWEVTAPSAPCEWLRQGWGAVLVDGRITTCCLDAKGAGVVAHVNDDLGAAELKPWGLCATCHLTVP